MRRIPADHAAERDHGRKTLAHRELACDDRQLESSRHARDQQIGGLPAMLCPGSSRAFQQAGYDEVIETRSDDRDAQIARGELTLEGPGCVDGNHLSALLVDIPFDLEIECRDAVQLFRR